MPRLEPFPTRRLPVVGMVHLPPLPGAPDYDEDMRAILSRVTDDVEVLCTAGFDGVIVENYGDTPFHPEA
ncbi:MAG: phosphorybosylanthranilate isomerase, partial [Gemmatimonadetes bacterium]|nr:phosphorybosylanthranilate isomerase [Gemmatimonadota bacterium]